MKNILCLSLALALLTLGGSAMPEAKGAITVQIGQNFKGATFNVDAFAFPPDSDGAVGPNHFVQFVNSRVTVYDKSTGTPVQTMTDGIFWQNTGINLGGLNVSDPRIIFDRLTQRWFATQVDFNRTTLSSNQFLVAVSTTADPTGPWHAVAFQADPAGNFADYPTFGFDANGFYMGANMFSPAGSFLGVALTSIPKADLLQTVPTAANRTYSGIMATAWGFTLQPVISFNATNGPEPVIEASSSGTDFQPHSTLTSVLVSNAVTASASFIGLTNITVPVWNVPLNPPQPNGSTTLDDGDSRIGSAVYQAGNFFYAVHSSQVRARAAIRWYKLNAGNRALIESGTISDASLNLFYPSIAANDNGYVVIGFNGCSTNTFISSYAVAGETVNGSTIFGSKILLKAGVANYSLTDSNGNNRWGDYSATSVDPLNPNHFWTIQEYPSSTNAWSTQITELQISPVLPALQIALSGANAVLSWTTNAPDFTLQSNNNLSTTNWITVTNVPAIVGAQFVVSNTLAGIEYYRLKK
ncbi:MAG: hypothetical protein JWR26_237 [Pedosphaera sp.]|nr:hypothetical protein [Pedosphaera sp.]